jgi:hypothetical protein
MPGPYTTFTRATSDVPGAAAGEHYYAGHASGLCRLLVWRPSASFTDARCLVIFKGGDFVTYGDLESSPETIDADVAQIAEDLSADGWVVVSVDGPPSPDSSEVLREATPFEYFPNQERIAAAAISYLKANASGIDDITLGPDGVALWGSGNSISSARLVVLGFGSGATTALLLAATPGPMLSGFAGDLAATVDHFAPRYDHRVAATIAFGASADWTQFDVNAAGSGVYSNDLHPHFLRTRTRRLWSTTDRRIKRAASPYFRILAGFPENLTAPVYARWAHSSDADGLSLLPADFVPGALKSDTGSAKAYRDPAHHFVGLAMGVAIAAKMDPRSKTTWGNVSDNSTTPALTSTTLHADVKSWLDTTIAV